MMDLIKNERKTKLKMIMMKMNKPNRMLLLLVLFMSTQMAYAQKGKVEQDLEELRTWVNTKLNRTDEATREERGQLKEQFNRLSANVDKGISKLSEQSKAEFKDLKSRYNQWEAKQQEQEMMYIDKEELSRRQTQLLGPHQNIRNIPAPRMRDAYVTFLDNVRERRRNWSPEDWVYAEEVLGRLNDRKDQVEASLSTREIIKIQAVRTEFGTLKAGRKTKDLYKEMK
jgi:hypothetical protein